MRPTHPRAVLQNVGVALFFSCNDLGGMPVSVGPHASCRLIFPSATVKPSRGVEDEARLGFSHFFRILLDGVDNHGYKLIIRVQLEPSVEGFLLCDTAR